MQIEPTLGTASGKLGGVVASHGRAGAQLRAHRLNTQPRSSSQQQNRALLAALGRAWRSLNAQQRSSWQTLAQSVTLVDNISRTYHPSGLALFTSCNRNRLAIGLSELLLAAPAVPSTPAVAGFEASALYDTPEPPHYLVGFLLSFDTISEPGTTALIKATGALSAVKSNIRPSDLRNIQTFPADAESSLTVWPTWSAIYGTAPTIGTVTFTMQLIDNLSGFSGPSVRASCGYTASIPSPTPPGTLLFEVNGTPVAAVPGGTVEVGGILVAGA